MKFTSENLARLQALFLQLCFAGDFIATKFGAATLNPWEILNATNITSLKTLLSQTQKSSDEYAKVDRWSADEKTASERERLKTWTEFLDLTIGYHYHLEQKSTTEELLAKKRADRDKLKLRSLSPEEKLAALDAEIAELEAA